MSQGSVTGSGTDSKFTAMNGDLDFVYDGKKEKREQDKAAAEMVRLAEKEEWRK